MHQALATGYGAGGSSGGGGSGPYSPTSFTANAILTGNGTGAINATGASMNTAGNVLTFAGTSTLTDSSGTITIQGGNTNGGVSLASIGTGNTNIYTQTSNLVLSVVPFSGTYSNQNFTLRPSGTSAPAQFGSAGNWMLYAISQLSIGTAGGTNNLQINVNATQTSANAQWFGGIFSFGGAWAIGTTSTAGIAVQNTTASVSSGGTIQYSPGLVFIGHAWNTTATAADNFLQAKEELRPVTGSAPTSALFWSFSVSATSTPSYSDRMNLTSAGALTLSSTLTTGAPTNGAGAWLLGVARTGSALVVSTTTGLQVQVGATTYTIPTYTTNP